MSMNCNIIFIIYFIWLLLVMMTLSAADLPEMNWGKDISGSILHYCCAATKVAIYFSHTGKISVGLTASVCNETTMPHILPAIMLCNTLLHNDMPCMTFFTHKRIASYLKFYSFWEWYSWKPFRKFWVQKSNNHCMLRCTYWKYYILYYITYYNIIMMISRL